MMADITNGSGGSKPTNTGGAARACAAASVKPREDAKSAELKGADYFEVEKIGSGAYGAISGVYNDDGELFARKTFDEADDTSIDIGSLREISILRLLTGDLAHRFIVQPLDFYFEEKDDALCMIMPKAVGSLQDVLARKLQLEKNGGKPRIAHQLLTALTFLHDNGIMHRDVKPDNVLLNEAMEPILCDFSLAKFVDCRYSGPTHSGDVGTAVYMAPEVYQKVPYGVKCDAYSAGVVLLELFQGSKIECGKDKQGQKFVNDLRQKLPQRPIGDLLRGLTAADPFERLSCRQALETNVLMQKKGGAPEVQKFSFKHAMGEHDAKRDWQKRATKKVKAQVAAMEFKNPMTAAAAMTYFEVAKQIDEDIGLAHCFILAAKLYETDQFDLEEAEDMDEILGDLMDTTFDIDNYKVDERTIIQAMDYNLFVF